MSLTRRKEIYLELHLETKTGVSGGKAGRKGNLIHPKKPANPNVQSSARRRTVRS